MKTTSSLIAEGLKKLARAGVMALTVAGATVPLAAQQTAPANSAVPLKAEPATPFVESPPSTPQKPGSEGIKIHGHWVIDVKNADGTIAQHRDFENALVPSGGGTILTGLLLGTLVPQTFDVVLAGTGTTALLYLSGQSCPQVLASFHGDCSATLTEDSLGGSSIVLRSTYAPPAGLTITTVSTNLGTCPQIAPGPVTYGPSVCQATTSGTIPGSGGAGVGIYNFTAATIPALVVAPGQSLAVSVTISFS